MGKGREEALYLYTCHVTLSKIREFFINNFPQQLTAQLHNKYDKRRLEIVKVGLTYWKNY